MKRILFVLAISALLAAPALAADYGPEPLGAYSVACWELDPSGTWVNTTDAQCFASVPQADSCNKPCWEIPVYIQASVAGWLVWDMTGTRWDYFVRKPGYYAANCISATIRSNTDVEISYTEFNNLVSVLGNTHEQEIPIWYGWGNGADVNAIEGGANGGWQTPAELMANSDYLDESYWNFTGGNIHEGLLFKLYSKIHVVDCNTACEYADNAKITICLPVQKLWIDEEGDFKTQLGDWIKWGIII